MYIGYDVTRLLIPVLLMFAQVFLHVIVNTNLKVCT